MKLLKIATLLCLICSIALVLIYSLLPKDRLLLSAVNDNDAAMADWMLKLGADINAHTSSAYTPLNLAVKNGDIGMIQKLLAHGANPNQQANYGSGEKILIGNLSLAINYVKNPLPIVRLLIESGLHPADDPVAFKDAIEKGNIELVKLLFQHGSDVNHGLQFAVMSNQLDIVKLLLNNGANPNTGVTLAKTMYNQDALQLLEQAGAVVKTPPREQTHPQDYTTVNGKSIRLR
jgi:ankyrin repeat protein